MTSQSALGRATHSQIAVARSLGLNVSRETEAVAAAVIHDAVSVVILDRPTAPSSLQQREFGSWLGVRVQSDSMRVASACIARALRLRNERAVRQLNLQPGDVVILEREFELDGFHLIRETKTISSVKNGILYFRGGNGCCASAGQVRRPNKREAAAIRMGKYDGKYLTTKKPKNFVSRMDSTKFRADL